MTIHDLISLCTTRPVVARLLLDQPTRNAELRSYSGLRKDHIGVYRGDKGFKVTANPETWKQCRAMAIRNRAVFEALIDAGRGGAA